MLTGKGLKSDVFVHLREGIYTLDQTIVFGLEDEGNDNFSVTYQAYPGETAVISSGIGIHQWEKVVDDPPDLLKKASGNVWVADIPKNLDLFHTMYDAEVLLPRSRSEGFNSTKKWVRISGFLLRWMKKRGCVFCKRNVIYMADKVRMVRMPLG